MKNILVEIMSQLTSLSEEEIEAIEESFPIKTFEKGTFLMKQGEVARNAYYVVEGIIREYELLDGEEKTTAFYTENDSAANFNSLANGTLSNRNFVCEEKTTVAIINAEKEQKLYENFPRFETFCRSGMEQMFGAQLEKMADTLAMKPEERYLKLMEERPNLINRVPQYHLASYLGIKPETLSRIRKRIVSKE